MCVARSTFYDAPAVSLDDVEIAGRMQKICDEFEAYGYRRIGAELRHQGVGRLLLRLGLEQIADKVLRLMLALERRGESLIIGALHSVELEFARHLEDFGSIHGHALLSWSYRAQSATGACWSLSVSGVKMAATGPGSRWRARMLMITSAEWTPSDGSVRIFVCGAGLTITL
jgi:hypothetical protein